MENDANYQQWLSSVGTAEAINYLCSSDASKGKTCYNHNVKCRTD